MSTTETTIREKLKEEHPELVSGAVAVVRDARPSTVKRGYIANPIPHHRSSGRARKQRQRIIFIRDAALALAAVIAAAVFAVYASGRLADTGAPQDAAELEAEPAAAVFTAPSSGTEYTPDAAEVEALAKLIYGEAGVVSSTTEQAAVVWCVLNRVDDPRFPDTVLSVITEPSQFVGYCESYPVLDEYSALAADVLTRWNAEKSGTTDVGRVLPAEYCFFTGDGSRNYFTLGWQDTGTWDWSLDSPYDD